MNKISYIESKQIRKDVPEFRPGDTVRIYSKIQEEGKVRLQAFEGTVTAMKGTGISRVFTVRRVSYGEGVERTFPVNSPSIDHINVVKKGKVKRAKLYYLRTKIGKKGKIEGEDIFQAAPDATPREEGEKQGA
ncbi:MAG: 50S ribosomal protein L19 [Candidatus Omnitrophota bacterium]|nr:50S ribosomal protein L19 [Candidatus Omnitrophota bacterium]